MHRYVRKAASAPKPVYLVDFAMSHPPDTWHMPASRFVPVNGLNTVSFKELVGWLLVGLLLLSAVC